MKIVYALLLTVIGMIGLTGCADDGNGQQTIYDRWANVDRAGDNGAILKLQEDGHYTLLSFVKSDTNNRVEAYVETGDYVYTPFTITFNPKQRTCPPTYSFPNLTYKYTLKNGILTLYDQGIPKEFNTEDAMGTMSNGVTLGCFTDDGFANGYLQDVN